MNFVSLTENFKFAELTAINTAANAFTLSDYVSCKNAHKVWLVIKHYSGGGDTDLTVGLDEATAVAGTTHAAVTATFPIYSNTASGTSSDTMTRRTDAASYVIDTGAGTNYVVVIEWDPALHTAGYDCIAVTGSGGNAGNRISVDAWIWTRYPADQPPSAIID